MNKKNILSGSIIASVLLVVLLSRPRTINWLEYWPAWYYIMGASWLIGMVIMTWQVILWIRPMFTWFTKDFFWVNWLHKRLGIWTLMALIFHPIASVISYGTSWIYVFSLDFSTVTEWWISIGKIAFDLILIVLITSILSRKILSYRKRHRVHLLSYPAFIGVWFHGWFTGTMIAEYPLMRWYWIALWVVLLVAMAARIAYQYWYLKLQSEILDHTQLTNDIFELKLQLPYWVSYQEWQFIYLQDKRWGESHPFTILSYDETTRIMIITYKVYGQFTQAMAKLAVWWQVYIDGPYGVFMNEVSSTNQPIVCIAAGIWITPFYQIIQNHSTTKDIKLFYLNKTKKDIVYESILESKLTTQSCIHVLSRESLQDKSNHIVNTRITKDILKKNIWNIIWSARFYLCGWGSVITQVTTMLLEIWVPKHHIDYEPFTM